MPVQRGGYTMDMTRGGAGRLLASFAAPLVLTNFFQQLYNVADSAVVGQLLGTEAFAAVGAAGWLYWLVLSVLIGLAQGFAVLVAQRFGAGDMTGMRGALLMSGCLMLAVSVALTAAGLLGGRGALLLLNTPDNIVDGAVVYLRFMFAALAVTAAYNMLAAALRAFGDGRSPLWALLIASAVNVGLNLLFVMAFGMGIAGVALATVLAQMLACAYCAAALWRVKAARVRRVDMEAPGATARRLLSLGWPMALRNAILACGGLAVQYIINGAGYVFVAGVAAARKFTDFSEQIGSGLDGAVTAFTGQNMGAGRMDRVRQGVRAGLLMALLCAAGVAVLMLAVGRPMLRLFITDGPGAEQALAFGREYLMVMSLCALGLFCMQVLRAAMEGLGDTVTAMLAGVVEMLVRVIAVFTLPLLANRWGIYTAEPLGWLLAGALLALTYWMRTRAPKDMLH